MQPKSQLAICFPSNSHTKGISRNAYHTKKELTTYTKPSKKAGAQTNTIMMQGCQEQILIKLRSPPATQMLPKSLSIGIHHHKVN